MNSRILIASALATTLLTGAASAAGTLAISAVAKPAPSQLQVTGTCVQGAGSVQIFVKKISSATWTSLATLGGSCGATAATAGKTVTVNSGGLSPGMYKVRLKQGANISAASSNISLP